MLKEDIDEDVTLLLQLPLQSIEDRHFVTMEPSKLGHACTVNTVDIGPLLPKASVSYQNNAIGRTISVGGIRTTASMLLMSQRRVRLFLLEDGNSDEEEEDEEEEKEDSIQQADTSADLTRPESGDRIEDEDKENIED
ncbi:unnamed protein product [Candidula unifasciata]|uniref:Uncharacterized protein n=1 Tax=Candidula unifasciata TaxID=100452 RepID=A0A8S3YJM3_9EUPU|nr:unnamed protein product [Candidula unifasciata]